MSANVGGLIISPTLPDMNSLRITNYTTPWIKEHLTSFIRKKIRQRTFLLTSQQATYFNQNIYFRCVIVKCDTRVWCFIWDN